MITKLNKIVVNGVQYFWSMRLLRGNPLAPDEIESVDYYYLSIECLSLYKGERGWDDIVCKMWSEEEYKKRGPVKESEVRDLILDELERIERSAEDYLEDE